VSALQTVSAESVAADTERFPCCLPVSFGPSPLLQLLFLPASMSSGGAAASASSTKAAYRNVVKGKLSLKGGTPKTATAAAAGGGTKKPAKRKPDAEETPDQIREREERELQRLLANKQAAEAKAASAAADSSAAASAVPGLSADDQAAAAKQAQIAELDLDASLTKAERDFERAQKQRELELIQKKIAKTHRQRVEEFNAYLGNLTEHNDIPRVGPG